MYKFRNRVTPGIFVLLGIAIGPAQGIADPANDVITPNVMNAAAENRTVTDPAATSSRNGYAHIGDAVITAIKEEVLLMPGTPTEASAAWAIVQDSGSKEDVFAFIEKYPNSPHAQYAKALMIDLLWMEMAQTPAIADTAPEVDVAPVAVSNDVELRSADGFVSVTGSIVDFDDSLITIKTSYGTVGVQNDGITCFGAACPAQLIANR